MATQTELKDALKAAAEKIAQYVQDAAEMAVETRYIEMGAESFDDARLAARTVVKLDGDSQTVVPMRKSEGGALVVDTTVFELHQQNVQAAVDYRTRMMSALLDVLRPQG
jgi:hypothetical protein